MSKPRIGILGMLHESNTFVSTTTTVEHFLESSLDEGPAILEKWRQRHHEVGGFLAGAGRFGFEPVPLLVAEAMPSGRLAEDTFEDLVGRMLAAVARAGAMDGILLALHGAASAVNHADADGEIVTRLRDLVGPDLPIVMTLDIHTNLSPRMVAGTTAIVVYRTVPHVDQRMRGLEAAQIMARTARGEVRPVQALVRPPLIINVIKHDTDEEPAASLMRDLEAAIDRPGILSASVCFGYPWADVAEMGSSFLAVADGDEAVARQAASGLAARVWDRRHEFVGELPTPEQAVRQAAQHDGQPVVLSDIGDNIGAGAPGDATILLREILAQGVANALVILWDPEAVRACVSAGVGADVSLEVGGKADALHGSPVALQGRVRTISDGRFHDPTPRHLGRTDYDQGTTVVVETPAQHAIVLTSIRMAPFSLQQVLSLGIDPRRKKIITAKAVVAPRAAYREVAAGFILVDTPGAGSANLDSFTYHRRRRPMFPFEPEAAFDPGPR